MKKIISNIFHLINYTCCTRMSERLLLQFRLVPFSISPHTAKGRLKHLCAFLVPSLRLINYVLPQRGHREAQRFLELGLRPRRPRLTAEGVSTCRRQSRSDGYGGAQNISAQPASARLRRLATLGAYLLAPPLRRKLK